MPNWVFNTLVVSGDETDLSAFRAEMSKPFVTYYTDSNYDKEKQEWTETPAIQEHAPIFALWNILSPDKSDYDEYFAVQPRTKSKTPLEDPNWFSDLVANQAVSKHWYDWNNHHWGTKWDVHGNVELLDESEKFVIFKFDTAWSPVDELLVNILSPRFPTLTFQYEYEEEQGWGGELTFKNGEVSEEKSWDIPSSHADYVALERVDSCPCASEDEEEFWYKDCPRETD